MVSFHLETKKELKGSFLCYDRMRLNIKLIDDYNYKWPGLIGYVVGYVCMQCLCSSVLGEITRNGKKEDVLIKYLCHSYGPLVD